MENTTNANDLTFHILCINSTQHLKDNIEFDEPIVKVLPCCYLRSASTIVWSLTKSGLKSKAKRYELPSTTKNKVDEFIQYSSYQFLKLLNITLDSTKPNSIEQHIIQYQKEIIEYLTKSLYQLTVKIYGKYNNTFYYQLYIDDYLIADTTDKNKQLSSTNTITEPKQTDLVSDTANINKNSSSVNEKPSISALMMNKPKQLTPAEQANQTFNKVILDAVRTKQSTIKLLVKVNYSHSILIWATSETKLNKLDTSYILPFDLNSKFSYKLYELKIEYVKQTHDVTTKEEAKRILSKEYSDIKEDLNNSTSSLVVNVIDESSYKIKYVNSILGEIELYDTNNINKKVKLPSNAITEIYSFDVEYSYSHHGTVTSTLNPTIEYSVSGKLAQFLDEYLRYDDTIKTIQYYDGNEFKNCNKVSIRTSETKSFMSKLGQWIEYNTYTVIVTIGNEDFYCYVNECTEFNYKKLKDCKLLVTKYLVTTSDRGYKRMIIFDSNSHQFYDITSYVSYKPWSNLVSFDVDDNTEYYIEIDGKPSKVCLVIEDGKLKNIKVSKINPTTGHKYLTPLKNMIYEIIDSTDSDDEDVNC